MAQDAEGGHGVDGEENI